MEDPEDLISITRSACLNRVLPDREGQEVRDDRGALHRRDHADLSFMENDDVVGMVQQKIEKSKIYKNLEILDEREKDCRGAFRPRARRRRADAAGDHEGAGISRSLCRESRSRR